MVHPPSVLDHAVGSRIAPPAAPHAAPTGSVCAPSAGRGRVAALGYAAARALGGLLPLIDDAAVRDLLVQVRDERGELWVDRDGVLVKVEGWRSTPAAVRQLAVELIAAGGRHLDELHPCADVHLGGGVRAHAVLPPVAVDGAAVSIRLPALSRLDFATLVRGGLCDTATAHALREAIAERQNVLITGGTASGKTTLLAALLDLVPHDERIITIEDVAELRCSHPHRVALEARQANTEGAGEVTLEQLLREALRMRPDRLVLGECRGPELVTMLSALNTGHDGGAATLHASRIEGVPARLEALGALAGLGTAALAKQVVSALHLVVHLERGDRGRRVISGLARLRWHGDELRAVPHVPRQAPR